MEKPCPFRKEHEWEWEAARQGWLCRNCYAFTDKREPVPPVQAETHETTSDTPTPPHPFPPLNALVTFPMRTAAEQVLVYDRGMDARFGVGPFDSWQTVSRRLMLKIETLEMRVGLLELQLQRAKK